MTAPGSGIAGDASPSADLVADFKAAMRKLAATVTLVTTREEGTPYGMPATAVSSLSADPPSLLVCINRQASMHGPTSRSRYFCVNLLAEDQAGLSRDFGARRRLERFEVGDWRSGPHDLPYLGQAAAVLFCAVDEELHYGTHTVFIGRILEVGVDPAARPLVYQAGRMGRFTPEDDL